MATGQRFLEGEVIEAVSADDPDLNAAFWDFRNAIEQEANAGGKISVFEVPVDANGMARPTTYQRAKLFVVPVGAVTIDDICDRVLRDYCRPGEKILIQLLARKDGEAGIKMNKLITLRAPALASGSTGTSGEIAQLMRVMNEQRAQDRADMQRMLEQVAGARAPAVDPMQQAMALTQTITALATGIVSKAAPAPVAPAESMVQSMTAMLGLMKMMREFSGKDSPPPSDDGGSKILENIRALAAPLLEAKAKQEERALIHEKRMLVHERANPPTPAPAPGEPVKTDAPQPTTTDAERVKQEAKMKLLAVLKEGLPMIVSLASGPKPADPAETAKLVLKNLPEDEQALNDAFYALVQDPPKEFLAQLAVVCPDVNNHAEWFEAFRQALLIEFDPDKLTA